MNIEDFQPRMCREIGGQSSNASVRSTTSKLSLRHKLSLSSQIKPRPRFDSHNESQRLSPPPLDGWASATSTPKIQERTQGRSSIPYLPGPKPNSNPQTARPKPTDTLSAGSYKENNAGNIKLGKKKTKTKNIPPVETITKNCLIKTPEKQVFPVFLSPQKATSIASPSPIKFTTPSPKKPVPSPSKSVKSRGSTILSVPLASKGFCPICQVPFTCLNVLSSVHSAQCQVPFDSPECTDGKNCVNTNFHHYQDFHHTELAEERALASPDNSEVADENFELLLVDELELLHHSPGEKRKCDETHGRENKRAKTPSVVFSDSLLHEKYTNVTHSPPADNESNPFFNPEALADVTPEKGCKSGPGSRASEDPNPFLDPAEFESSGDEDGPFEADGGDIENAEEKGADTILGNLGGGAVVPCVPGVCDAKQLMVTVTLSKPDGTPLKVRGVGGSDGWCQVEGADRPEVCMAQCRCKHNLHLQCEVPPFEQSVVPHIPPSGAVSKGGTQNVAAAKSLWGPLMKKMTSVSSSPSSSSSSSSSSGSSLAGYRCPHFKLIPGTRFAVDAFNCGDVPGVKFYFLSHFHYDHYIGLTSKWNHVIYCSAITARLVKKQLRVRPELLRVLELDQTKKVDGVVVTPLDANHCPGSLMLLFQLGDGINHLHTGDFRASSHMESYSAFWNLDVQTLFLDTTYCNSQYDFPTQEEVVNWAVERAKVNAERFPARCLFVCGSYTIGKEKVFLGVAEGLDCRIWAPPNKARVLRLLEDPRISERLTARAEEAQVHVLPMSQISMKGMQDYLRTLKGRFSEIVAFRPSGWQFSGERNTMHSLEQSGSVTVCGLPYSEHSSFSELRRFVQFLRPHKVVPTVRSKGRTWAQIRDTCQQWLKCSNMSLKEAYSSTTQTSLEHWRLAQGK